MGNHGPSSSHDSNAWSGQQWPLGLGRLHSPLPAHFPHVAAAAVAIFLNNIPFPDPSKTSLIEDSSSYFSMISRAGFYVAVWGSLKYLGNLGRRSEDTPSATGMSLIGSVAWLNKHWWAKLVFLFLPQDQPGLSPVLYMITYRRTGSFFESSVKSWPWLVLNPGKNPNPNKNTAEET